MNYFYILRSEVDNGYYYGSTVNLKRRINEHQNGLVIATKYRRPIEMIYYEAYKTISAARLREKQVKISGSVRSALQRRIH